MQDVGQALTDRSRVTKKQWRVLMRDRWLWQLVVHCSRPLGDTISNCYHLVTRNTPSFNSQHTPVSWYRIPNHSGLQWGKKWLKWQWCKPGPYTWKLPSDHHHLNLNRLDVLPVTKPAKLKHQRQIVTYKLLQHGIDNWWQKKQRILVKALTQENG